MINKRSIKNLILEDIKKCIFLYDEKINIDNVETNYINEFKHFSEESKEFIDNNFKKEREKNSKTFNGNVLGFVSFENFSNKIHVGFERGEFKHILASKNEMYKKFIFQNDFFMVAIGGLNIIKTKDDKIFLGCPNENKLGYKFPGGYFDSSDVKHNKIQILEAIERECKEEIGDLKTKETELIGIFLNNEGVTFVISSYTDLTSEEILEIYNKNKDILEDSYEMNNLIFVNNDIEDIGNLILKQNFLTNISKESLKLYLKNYFSNYEYINA